MLLKAHFLFFWALFLKALSAQKEFARRVICCLKHFLFFWALFLKALSALNCWHIKQYTASLKVVLIVRYF